MGKRMLGLGLVVGLYAMVVPGCFRGPITLAAGVDQFVTQAVGTKLDQTNPKQPSQVLLETRIIEFSANPLPIGFFGAGSDPFGDDIPMMGNPLGASTACDGDLGMTDTIIRRLEDANLPNIGSTDTVPIQLVELSLQSVQPITVTYNGGNNPEMWDVAVMPFAPNQPQGDMTIRRTEPGGGKFDFQVDFHININFTRQSDGSTRVTPVITPMVAMNQPWSYKPRTNDCSNGFVPGLGSIPIVNHLFRRDVHVEGDSLIMLVTPRIIVLEE